jgi:photosystem II stability/assembly factor-like uncharacterized protein
MKGLILILIIPMFISSSIFPQWVNHNPVPDGNHLRSVYFINDNTGWMVGSDGFITKTENAGEVWHKQESNTNVQLRSIYFVNQQVGWCVGDGIILNTTNGGESWEIQLSDTIPDLNAIQFLDENLGWTVGNQGTILKTENGGMTWEIVNVGITNNLNSLFFVNQQLGFIVGNGGVIMKTVDGGTTWEQNFLSGDLYKVTFVNESVGWLTGKEYSWDSFIQKTTDGGNNWWYQIFSDSPFGDIHFINEDLGCAVLNGGHYGLQDGNRVESNPNSGSGIITTTDGGISWIGSGAGGWHLPDLYSIYITNAGVGFAVGSLGLVCITVDSGLAWDVYISGGSHSGGTISDLAITTKDGIDSPIAVGQHGTFDGVGWIISYHPIPGTNYWIIGREVYNNDDEGPSPKLEFINDSVGFAYRWDFLSKTYDRGNTWTLVWWGGPETKPPDELTLYNYYDMFFLDENVGFFQHYSNLYKTTNSGSTWEIISSYDLSLRSFLFFDENTGIATSEDKIYKTTNGGISWFEIFNQGGRELLFVNSSVGFVVGKNGNIFKTTNMGNNWFQVNHPGVNEDLNDLFFIDENRGYVVGNNGTVLVTLNSGNTWYQQDMGVYYNLRSVIFVDDNVGYIAAGSAFFMTENGGGVIPVELISLTATTKQGKVILNWQTSTETNNLGFEIKRRILQSESSGEWTIVGFKEGHGTTTEMQNYQFIDNISDLHATSLGYRLKQIDYDGSYEYSKMVEVTNLAPKDYSLQQNYPNPFNPVTTISYSLPVKSQVELVVYNTLGESVVQLVNEQKEAGRYEVKFDSHSGTVRNLPSGIYFYRIQAGSFNQTKKMIILK